MTEHGGRVSFVTHLPDTNAYVELFETTGWNTRYRAEPADLARALSASWATVSAYAGGELVGFGRVISDGVLYAVLFDVIVDPDHRRRGIGREIVRRLLARCADAGIRDVQLFSAAGKVRFYERLGFHVRSSDAPGMRYGPR